MTGSVVITGGCGFLGAALARKIREDGVTLPNGQRLSNPRLHLWDRSGSVVPTIENALFTAIDISDAVMIIAYIFAGGPAVTTCLMAATFPSL